MGAPHFRNVLEAVAGGGIPYALDATAASIRDAINDPASYGTTYGPERVVNGSLASGLSGWSTIGSVAVVGQSITFAATSDRIEQFPTGTAGRTHRLTLVASGTGTASTARVITSDTFAFIARAAVTVTAAVATYSVDFVMPANGQVILQVISENGTGTMVLSSASIREVIATGYRLPGIASARLNPSARASVAMQQRRDDLLGSELVANGEFAVDTAGWGGVNAALSVVNGRLRITATSAGFVGAQVLGTFPTPRQHRYSVTIASNPFARTVDLYVQNAQAFAPIPNALGTYSGVVTSAGTTEAVSVFMTAAQIGDFFEVDSISVREVIVPALGWEFAPHNLLANSETAAATVGGGAVDNGIVVVAPPPGVPASSQVRQFTMTGLASLRFGLTSGGTSGARLTAGLWVRAVSGSVALAFDCNDGTAVGPTITTAWQFLSADNTANLAQVFQFADLVQNAGSSVIYVCAPRICLGPTATSYVPTTTTAVYGPAIDWLSGIGAYGLRSEEARTNSIRNSACVGGGVGAFPTNWSGASVVGVTVSATGAGTENGFPYLDVRFNGTASGVGFPSVNLETTTQIAAANGQTWTGSVFYRVVGGTLPSGVSFTVSERAAGGGYLIGSSTALTTSAATQRAELTRPLNNASTASVHALVELQAANATAYDFTLRIACPQLEQGAFATSPILTYGAAAIRAADAVQIIGLPSGIDSEGTMVVNFVRTLTAPSGIFPGIFDLGASTNERHIGYVSQGTIANAGGERRVGGVPQGAASGTGASGLNKFAYAWTQTNAAVAQNGAAASQVAATTLPTGPISRLNIGFADADRLNGGITRVRFATRRMSNAELQALTA